MSMLPGSLAIDEYEKFLDTLTDSELEKECNQPGLVWQIKANKELGQLISAMRQIGSIGLTLGDRPNQESSPSSTTSDE